MATKPSKHRNTANPELAAAMRELGRSSACQRHTPKARKGTRGSRDRAAMADFR